ncbi:MAG: glycine zipper 2TM domain-containing protein [Burkholderiales bacterium]|nr:glycine zipper 2TM domain-containing protein [Burkholderiales bacterium]
MESQVNKIEPQSGKFPQALIWIAGIALTLFCAVGIAAVMGWIPNSLGGPAGTDAAQVQSAIPPATVAAKKRAPAVKHTAPAPVAVASAPTPAPVAVAAATCAECGVIESVREIASKGAGSGLGAVGGGVVGGLLGNQVGGGRGQDVMTVVGVVGGALAGNEVEKRVKTTKSYEVTVRLDNGTSRVFSEASLPSWRNGDKVRIVNGVIRSNG